MDRDEVLFNKFESSDVIPNRQDHLAKAVDGLNDARLMAEPVDELIESLVREYILEVPLLKADQTTTQEREVDIDVSHEPGRFSRVGGPIHIKGTEISFFVPFSGTSDLFHCRPSTRSTSPPRAQIGPKNLVIHVTSSTSDAKVFRKSFDETVADIDTHLRQLRIDLQGLQDVLRQAAKTLVERRREKRRKDTSIVDQLGFPRRTGA